MRIDDAPAGEARKPDVRERRERLSVRAHVLESDQRSHQTCAVIRPDRRDIEIGQPLGRLARGHACEGFGALVEGHQRDDRKARDGAGALDRVHQLVEVVERLDHEQVRSSALEHLGLLGEELPAHARGGRLSEGPDGAADEDVAPGRLARVAGQLDRGRVDLLELVLEEVLGELAPVRAEAVRLDQLGARVDKADVEGDDGVRGAQVCLLGAAQARHGGRDERSHPAVADDCRAVRESLQKSACQPVPF